MRFRLIVLALLTTPLMAANWPAWRGPNGDGISSETEFPKTWSQTENIVWKTPLPGPGNSTPIVWGNKVFITQATEKGKRRATMAFNRKDGTLLWKKEVEFNGNEPTHGDNPYCSATPITDGERIVVWHGSAGLF